MPDAASSARQTATVTITAGGRDLVVPAGITIGAALLLHGIRVLRRSDRDEAPRGLFCAMGICFECLVTVDGQAAQRACRVRVRDGLRVELPAALP